MKTQFIIVSIVAVLLAVAAGVGFWMYFDTKVELADTKAQLTIAGSQLADTEAELANTEAELEAIEAKYPLKHFASKGELEDWIDSHSYPTTWGDDDEFDNALQVQIDAMNEGYLIGIQMDWFSELGSYWIGNSAMAGSVFYHFRVGDDVLYAQPFP